MDWAARSIAFVTEGEETRDTEQAEQEADPSNQAPRPGRQSISKGSVHEGDVDRLRKVEGVGRIHKLESFVRRLAVDEEEAGAQQDAQHDLEAEAASSAASTVG